MYQSECKNYCRCKKDLSRNPSTHICENSKYLKGIADESVIVCNKIVNVTDSVLTNVTNTIPTNVMNTAKCHKYSANNF